jgi:hypothetical protein
MKLTTSGTSVYVTGDSASPGLTFPNMGNLKTPLSIAITSDGPQRTLSLNERGSMFYLDELNDDAPVTLTIDNVILQGLSAVHPAVRLGNADFDIVIPASSPAMDNNNTLVYVGEGNSFEMLGSAELTGNYNANPSSDGRGGAARVLGGIFRMTGANTKIHHNYAGNYAGGVRCGDGQLIMAENAEVSYNAGANGVGGIYMGASYFAMSGHAKISGNQGGNQGGINSHYPGGGIQLNGTEGVMSDYAEISGNYAYEGGGVMVTNVTNVYFTMSGPNVAIRGNKADHAGGGVIVKSTGAFIMEGGTISGNSVAGGNGGGGVFISHSSTFTMKGGTIYGTDAEPTEQNIAAGLGNASIYLEITTCTAIWPAGTTGYVGIVSVDERSGTFDPQELTVRAVTP